MLKDFTRELEIQMFEKARIIDGENIKNAIAGNPLVPNPIREALIEQVMLLVPFMIKRVRKKSWGTNYDDYMSEGFLLIVDAYLKYDHTRGFRWTTYVSDCLWKRFINWDSKNRLIKSYKGEVAMLGDAGGRIRMLADHDEIDLEPVTREGILECCEKLSDREREILLRRMEGDTLQVIAKSQGVTKERIRQIESRVKEKVKDELRKRWPGDELN